MGHKERLDAWFVGKQASIQAFLASTRPVPPGRPMRTNSASSRAGWVTSTRIIVLAR
jgi:hypothetical protein